MTDTTRHCGLTAHLIIPELRDFLVLHGRIIPDEVGSLVIIPGLDETHLTDDYPNYRRKAQLKGFLYRCFLKDYLKKNTKYSYMDKKYLK